MKRMIAVLAAAALTGCATLGDSNLGKTDTFAKCAAADVATTTIGLATGAMTEVNPLTNALAIKSMGHVAGTVIPVIGLSIAGYYLLKWINNRKVTAVATTLTCAVAFNNAGIIITY